jgi:hypothetical protein
VRVDENVGLSGSTRGSETQAGCRDRRFAARTDITKKREITAVVVVSILGEVPLEEDPPVQVCAG